MAGAEAPVDYRMINTLSVRNFKCFKSLDLTNLKRFNVIVGRNAGGKTALLEALFLMASTSAQKVLMLRAFRGMGPHVQVSTEPESFAALWRDLFFDFDESASIEIKASGSDDNSRSLVISKGNPENVVLPFGTQPNQPNIGTVATTNFLWTKANGDSVLSTVSLRPDGLDFGLVVEGFQAIFLTPVFREPPSENGKRFSQLSKTGKHKGLLDVIQSEFPFIQDLSLEYHGGSAMIHASLRSTTEKVPLPFVSDGVNKFTSILLALETFQRGVVLVDEMENGFYFDRMGSVSATSPPSSVALRFRVRW